MWILFIIWYFAFFAWQYWEYGDLMLPESASVHGVDYDNLMLITMVIITFVFIVTHIVLAIFLSKFAWGKDRVAEFFTHSNKLEIIWTTIPIIALTILISYGLYNWNSIMEPVGADEDHVLIEVYARQFDWTARYAGEDNKLGRAHISFIEGANFLGVDESDPSCKDDKIVKGEFHLPIGKPVQFVFRSQDVIHSAYMPHFRAQMNCVPGLQTLFNFTPSITTAEMREITENEEFDYILLCNKICGSAHYNMQMNIIVESQEDYDKWLAEQKTFQN